jgi:hypothetical protein
MQIGRRILLFTKCSCLKFAQKQTMSSNTAAPDEHAEKTKVETSAVNSHTTTSSNTPMGGPTVPKIKNAYEAEATATETEIYEAFMCMLRNDHEALERLDHESTKELLLQTLGHPNDYLTFLAGWCPRFSKRSLHHTCLLGRIRTSAHWPVQSEYQEMSDSLLGMTESEVELHAILHAIEHNNTQPNQQLAVLAEKLQITQVHLRYSIERGEAVLERLQTMLNINGGAGL